MVWDQLKSSSFQVNEEMIETLFICNPANAPTKEATRRPVLLTPRAENKVLDPKKAQNIAILLRALNVTKEEVCDVLCEGIWNRYNELYLQSPVLQLKIILAVEPLIPSEGPRIGEHIFGYTESNVAG
ncbi:hypothetical protein ZEAMMB73_Zm00001d035373 [Zea mays]|uniref:FH2 domain-containing protein n=1 Tax=Zea mays TaxID=4577 RepID=A0A1D6LG73_MAIZE|nr:hypothetical protein ZEAMMB73_Zm00001d035373 [Zea mays]